MLAASSAPPAGMWPGTTTVGCRAAISSSWATQALRSATVWVSAVHTWVLVPNTPMVPTTALMDGIHAYGRCASRPVVPRISTVWPSTLSVLPAIALGSTGVRGALAPILGPQKASLPASLALIFSSTAGVVTTSALEDFFQRLHAKVVVRVGLAHVDGLELFARVEHVGGNAQRIGTGKAGVDDHGFFVAIDQRGVDVEAVAVGVVDLDLQRLGSLGAGEGNGEGGGNEGGAEHSGFSSVLSGCADDGMKFICANRSNKPDNSRIFVS